MIKRKLGPLPLWQWMLIGAVVGVGTVLYRRGHPSSSAAQNALAAATPSTAQYNPIDPTTGMPIAGGVSGGFSTAPTTDTSGLTANTTNQAPGQNLTDLLTGFGQLEGLLAGLTEMQGTAAAPVEPGPVSATDGPFDPSRVGPQVGTKRAPKKTKTKRPKKYKKTTHAGAGNPGHAVISHGGGRKSPSSSAPHNPRQHDNVAAPHHQRHDPTRHSSAGHPGARRTGAPHTPAAHPPARRAPAAHELAGAHESAGPVTHVAPPAPRTPPPVRRPAKNRRR